MKNSSHFFLFLAYLWPKQIHLAGEWISQSFPVTTLVLADIFIEFNVLVNSVVFGVS